MPEQRSRSFVVAVLALAGVTLALVSRHFAGASRVVSLAGFALVYAAFEAHRRPR